MIAGLRYGRPTDKGITIAGISFAAMPEFVTGIVLILVFGIWLGWLPGDRAVGPEGSSLLTQVKYLLLPAFTLTLVLFGYIARITRAGMIEALDSDYTRTAYLKGLPSSVVVRRHVLRNALLPTIAVVAVQVGYLVGGLVVVEVLFNYQGIGLLIYEAAREKDLPLLTAGVLVVGIVYLVVTLIADLLYALLNPRIRFGAPSERRVAADPPPARRRRREAARPLGAAPAALRSPTVLVGVGRHRLLGLLRALPRRSSARTTRSSTTSSRPASRRRWALPVRHRHERARRLLPRARRLAQHPPDRPGRDAARHRARHDPRAHHRLLPRRRRRRHRAASSTPCSRCR